MLDSWRHDTPKYTMCAVVPAELHHRLTRARGGKILDKYGETYHLMRLCRKHHKYAHEKGAGTGLMLDGYVVTCLSCKEPLYDGPDQFLTNNYGPTAHEIIHSKNLR